MKVTCFASLSKLIALAVGLLRVSVLAAQPTPKEPPYLVNVRYLTQEDGLPERTALCISQDRQGFVWVGSFNGAYRFDGKLFSALQKPATPANTYSPEVCSMGLDRAGNFWLQGCMIANKRTQYVIRPGTQQAEPAQTVFGPADGLPQEPVVELARAPDNRHRYFRTRTGQILYQTRQGQFRPIFRHPDLVADSWRTGGRLLQTKRHTLLATLVPLLPEAPRTLIELDSTGQVLRRYPLLPRYTMIPVGEGPGGSIYVQHLFSGVGVKANEVPHPDRVLYRLNSDQFIEPVPLGLPPQTDLSDTHINYDHHHGLFWITGRQLLVAWHPQHGLVFDLEKSGFPIAGTQQLMGTFVDRTGAVWVSSVNGFLVLTVEPNRFRRYLHADEKEPTTRWQPIRAMTQLGNQLWVNAPTCQLIDLSTGKARPAVSASDVHPIYTRDLYPLVQTPDKALWAFSGGVLRYDPQTTKASAYTLMTNNNSVAAWPDTHGTIWLGLQHGLLGFDTERKQPVPFTRYNQFTELGGQRITGFFPDRSATPTKSPSWLWLTTSSGLYQFDPVRGITARYSSRDKAPHQLPFDHIAFINPDPDEAGVYWLATLGGGLVRWNRAAGTWQQFTTREGLSDNTLYAIYEDRYGRLWLPSNKGLMSFHRQTHQIQIYHTKDGISNEEFNLLAHYRASDGRLFLGGLNGITAFYPDQIQHIRHGLAPLMLTNYEKFDTETGQMKPQLADIQKKPEIHLTAQDRLFRLSFSLLDYRYLDQTRLWYRIRGWQEKWALHDQLSLQLNGLPWGDYALEVRAQNTNGDWISNTLAIPIQIDRPVYLQTWFLSLLALGLGLGLRAFIRYRNRQLRQANALLEAEVARRTAQIERDKALIERQAADLKANATLKARFFANVSHEFRTPLTLLVGPIRHLAGLVSDARARQLLAAMERNTNQLLQLVNDILDLSKLDAQQLTLREQPTDLMGVVRQTLEHFLPQVQYAQLHLQLTGPDTDLWMPLDASKLETVLRNLLANAIRYTPTGGHITVSVEQQPQVVLITVTDTGQGIHPNDLPHIFERYFQTQQTDKPLQGGTGIGLALCQEYCQLWGGTLTVSSEVGKGSAFTLSYPIRKQTNTLPLTNVLADLPTQSLSLPTPAPTAEPEQPTTHRPLVLVVEDNPDMANYIRSILLSGYAVRTAHNGREALDWLQTAPTDTLPQLILTDVMMPELDGLSMLTNIRQLPSLKNIPVILLTARADLDARLQALQMGVADYLTKPFYETELLARIENLLTRAEEQTIWQEQPQTNLPDPNDLPDAEWTSLLEQLIRQNRADVEFNVRTLAEKMNLSERALYRRVKELTGFSPNQLIQEVRLQIAYELFQQQPPPLVKSVAYQVGYQNLSYFTRLYRARFGVNPSEEGAAPHSLSENVEMETENPPIFADTPFYR